MRSEEIYNEWFKTYGAWVELDGKINATPNEIRHLASLAYSAGVRDAAERIKSRLPSVPVIGGCIAAEIISLLDGKGAEPPTKEPDDVMDVGDQSWCIDPDMGSK